MHRRRVEEVGLLTRTAGSANGLRTSGYCPFQVRKKDSGRVFSVVFLRCRYRKSVIRLAASAFRQREGPRGIAVGTAITDRPPHRSVRAELPHTALTLDGDEQTALWDKDG